MVRQLYLVLSDQEFHNKDNWSVTFAFQTRRMELEPYKGIQAGLNMSLPVETREFCYSGTTCAKKLEKTTEAFCMKISVNILE